MVREDSGIVGEVQQGLWVRVACVSAVRVDGPLAWVSARGSVLRCEAGDWLLSDGTAEWTVRAGVFAVTYRRCGGCGGWRKHAPVTARQVAADTEVDTLEGRAVALAGDWVVRNPGGDEWPVPAGVFERHYRRADGLQDGGQVVRPDVSCGVTSGG